MAERRRRVGGLLLGAAVLGALAFLVAGCGGGSSSAAAGTTAATTTNATGAGGARSAAFQAFATCLKQHGITAPSGGGFGFFGRRRPNGTGTVPRTNPGPGTETRPRTRPALTPAEQKAFTACRSKLPGGGFGGGGFGGGQGRNNPAFTRYTQCLRKHGVVFGQSSSPSTFAKAQKACAKLRPSFGTPPPGATTTSSA